MSPSRDYRIKQFRKHIRASTRSLVAGHGWPEAASLYHPGCTREEFVAHLVLLRSNAQIGSKFDFVKPLTAFDLYDVAEVRKACHYTNIGMFTSAEMVERKRAEHSRLVSEALKQQSTA